MATRRFWTLGWRNWLSHAWLKLVQVTTLETPQRRSCSSTQRRRNYGTVGYMSPEQAQGKTNEIDQRSDIFSFAASCRGRTSKKPFDGDSVVKSLHSLIYEPAPQIKDLNPAAPGLAAHRASVSGEG